MSLAPNTPTRRLRQLTTSTQGETSSSKVVGDEFASKWIPLSLDSVQQISKQVDEVIYLLKTLHSQIKNKNAGPLQILVKSIRGRVKDLKRFYGLHDLDPRAIHIEKQRLKLKRALLDVGCEEEPAGAGEEERKPVAQQGGRRSSVIGHAASPARGDSYGAAHSRTDYTGTAQREDSLLSEDSNKPSSSRGHSLEDYDKSFESERVHSQHSENGYSAKAARNIRARGARQRSPSPLYRWEKTAPASSTKAAPSTAAPQQAPATYAGIPSEHLEFIIQEQLWSSFLVPTAFGGGRVRGPPTAGQGQPFVLQLTQQELAELQTRREELQRIKTNYLAARPGGANPTTA